MEEEKEKNRKESLCLSVFSVVFAVSVCQYTKACAVADHLPEQDLFVVCMNQDTQSCAKQPSKQVIMSNIAVPPASLGVVRGFKRQ